MQHHQQQERPTSPTSILQDPNIRNPFKKSVAFKETVTIRTIPHWNRYPVELKREIWNSTEEIVRMAHRNTIEFRAEGWDWRSVVLEEDMHMNILNGELIHPCHYDNISTAVEETKEADDGHSFSHNYLLEEMVLC